MLILRCVRQKPFAWAIYIYIIYALWPRNASFCRRLRVKHMSGTRCVRNSPNDRILCNFEWRRTRAFFSSSSHSYIYAPQLWLCPFVSVLPLWLRCALRYGGWSFAFRAMLIKYAKNKSSTMCARESNTLQHFHTHTHTLQPTKHAEYRLAAPQHQQQTDKRATEPTAEATVRFCFAHSLSMCHCKNVRREKEQCACKRLFGFTYVSVCVFCNLSAVPHIYVVRFRGDDKKKRTNSDVAHYFCFYSRQYVIWRICRHVEEELFGFYDHLCM